MDTGNWRKNYRNLWANYTCMYLYQVGRGGTKVSNSLYRHGYDQTRTHTFVWWLYTSVAALVHIVYVLNGLPCYFGMFCETTCCPDWKRAIKASDSVRYGLQSREAGIQQQILQVSCSVQLKPNRDRRTCYLSRSCTCSWLNDLAGDERSSYKRSLELMYLLASNYASLR